MLQSDEITSSTSNDVMPEYNSVKLTHTQSTHTLILNQFKRQTWRSKS